MGPTGRFVEFVSLLRLVRVKESVNGPDNLIPQEEKERLHC